MCLSHVVHYGSSVFEGMRAYKSDRGPILFRLREHSVRLLNSAKIYRMEVGYTAEQIDQAIIDLIDSTSSKNATCRPVVYRATARSRSTRPTARSSSRSASGLGQISG